MSDPLARAGLAGWIFVLWIGAAAWGAAGDELKVTCTQNTKAIIAYDVFELIFQHEGTYADPFRDVSIDVTFTAPGGKEARVGGFHYGSLEKPRIQRLVSAGGQKKVVRYLFAKADTWKARFAPNEPGRWRWSYVFRNNKGQEARGSGELLCVKGRRPNPGFLRQDPAIAFAWVFDDGSPYWPIGLQECVGDGRGLGTFLAEMSMEGPFRLERPANWPAPPEGATFKPGPAMNPVNADMYFRRYARCGFNLFRYSPQNCSPAVNQNLERYLVMEGMMTDELLAHARKYGMRIMYGIFGFQQAFNNESGNAAGMEKVRRFVKYSVDRWGAYTDVWELFNEQNAEDGWYTNVAPYLKSIDPYHHPVATSWERPQLPDIDVCAPHWYTRGDELSCDRDTAGLAARWKKSAKPVIVGEHGNTFDRKNESRAAGIGGVWDTGSATRMRIRNWSAMFQQISLVFWNTSYAKDGHYMNIWLGPREREYVRAMQDFAYTLGGRTRMSSVELAPAAGVRAYGLASNRRAGVYLHHFKDHKSAVKDLRITVEAPVAGTAYWYSPETAAILGKVQCPAGRQSLVAPAFVVDLALLITPDGAPDIDKDGKSNDVDEDDDNDGVPDVKDAFPLEPEEWADADGDQIGDNMDADKDADGVGDDDNKNGTPDHQEMDIDGDGVPRAGAVPWDAFPWDKTEWRDTDGDGIGDNADTDDDGDGFSDEEEIRAGTDPLNRLSFPVEDERK